MDQTAYAQQYRIGSPLNISLLFKYDGIDPETGFPRVLDVNGDNRYSYEDRIVIENRGREFYGGISNDFKYKGWSLSFLWDFTKQSGQSWSRGYPGRDKTNRTYAEYMAWQDGTLYIEDSAAASTSYGLMKESDQGISDASYIRLKTLL